jgi:tetratricopeptide (TPR) repeat protein
VNRARALCLLFAATAAAQQDQAPAPSPFQPFDAKAFHRHFAAAGAPETELARFALLLEQGDAGAACDEFLRARFPAYGTAVQQAQAGEPAAALALAKLVAETEDPYLRAHARYQLARVFLDGDDPERAAALLRELLEQDRNRTPLDGEALFFFGEALREIPQAEQALRAFAGFLQFFPDAPERFRSSAQQQVAELMAQMDSPLHGIADSMKNVERRIKRTDTGKETQRRQDEIVAELQKIIEEIEERERQAGGGPGGLNNPSNPATKSALPDAGATRIGALGKVPGVADRWGRAKDQERAAIETDVQQSLPPHYRKMLEEYYRKLGTGRK